MNSITQETRLTVVYILVAFTFSVLMRMIWIYQFNDYEMFKYAGEFMINTNDGYFWAEGARDLLSGSGTNPMGENFYDKFHQFNDLSPVSTATAHLTALLAWMLPFSFESIILYMPVYLSSLVVIPIILIAKSIDNLEMGLIAALLASIAWSYYNRTMIGYYDTDMLNIVLPMFLLWSITWAIKTNQDKYLIITALDILVYRWWYPQSYALEFSFFGLILVYALVFDRKNMYNYKLLAIMMFAMLNIDGFIRFPLVLAVFFMFKQEHYQKYVYHLFAISVALFFISGGFNPIWGKLTAYIFDSSIQAGDEGLGLHFFTVMQTIREAGKIPFETFANRISGHTVSFIVSCFGYVYLVYKHKIMIFALPLVGLGFLASVGGLRFTIYAVPVLALGIAFLITELSSKMPTNKLKYLSIIAFTLMVLLPNYKHIEAYRIPTVMNASEVAILDKLKEVAQRDDYVISWWDYGYPIRYYADVKTLGDGGKHSGSVNFGLSFVLTASPELAAKMARLDVEFTERSFIIRKENMDKNESEQTKVFSNIEEMTKAYDFDDTNDFLYSLQTDVKLPKKTRDIYFYLPHQMLNIYPTVKIFSNLDLMNGEQEKAPFFFVSRNFKETQEKIILNSAVFMDKKDLTLSIKDKKVAIKRFVKTGYTKDMRFSKNIKYINESADLSIIYMSAYNTFLVLDEDTYNSMYIQLSVLEEYDKSLFEQVVVNPHAKIYKLKL
ncbi:MAG: STT3 domain-containing protein [Sulfurimonas sp.]|nr:STT3 domain-containing protein [Sulfurimonas sp.]